ncbi:thymidine phosphorylase [bacterium]|nr:thymidine phosphorylase [bacterium]
MTILKMIKDKRDGNAHTQDEIRWLVDNVSRLPDYQLSAWLMAVVLRGMTIEETTFLTHAMAHSGQVMDLSDVPGPRADKHSTGGVGDKVTLVLGPLVAAAGVTVAKLSGRGLGHTGGTVDKIEAIPGMTCDLTVERFKQQLCDIGIVLASQTAELAPADAILYALRDVTGTVESIPLIAASVLSKKIAAGADVILLDVKTGAGAFMRDDESARELATTMMQVGERLGKHVACVVSEMGQPLGSAVGHANEVAEAIATLRGEGPTDLTDLSVALGALILVGGGLAKSREEGEAKLREVIESGAALSKFEEVIKAQGGDPEVVRDPSRMAQPQFRIPVEAPQAGFVQDLDALSVGLAGKEIGAGRLVKGAPIDLAVGIMLHKKVGDWVEKGETLAHLLVNDESKIPAASQALLGAYRIGSESATPAALVKAVYSAEKSALK